MSVLRWRSDLNKAVITSNFEVRGWQAADSEDGWDIWWASTASVQQLFRPNALLKLRPGQLVNHFPNHYECTHKDLLVKNINRYRRRMRKAGHSTPHIIPPTFVLPQDYALFVEEFKKQPGSTTFILKPARKAQGKGIFLINKLSQVKQQIAPSTPAAKPSSVPAVFVPSGNPNSSSSSSRQTSLAGVPSRPGLEEGYVVSGYIANPLLVLGGAKFDLRLYVLVPSFRPLVVYLSSLGFARFTSVAYTREVAELDNQFVHLTNVAVQKEGTGYNSSHGNKWPLQDLWLYLEATRGHGQTAQLFRQMQELVVHTLKAVQPVMISDRRCFELYGFDVIIDADLQPWLIEVNASPSMSSTTQADRLLKWQVVHDTLSIVAPPDSARPTTTAAASSGHASGSSPTKTLSKKATAAGQQEQPFPAAVGCMQLIHHDGLEAPSKTSKEGRRPGKRAQTAVADVAGAGQGAAAHKHVVLHG